MAEVSVASIDAAISTCIAIVGAWLCFCASSINEREGELVASCFFEAAGAFFLVAVLVETGLIFQ